MNEGHFTLNIDISSYVNPDQVYSTWKWDKCYCLIMEVVFFMQFTKSWKGTKVLNGYYVDAVNVILYQGLE